MEQALLISIKEWLLLLNLVTFPVIGILWRMYSNGIQTIKSSMNRIEDKVDKQMNKLEKKIDDHLDWHLEKK